MICNFLVSAVRSILKNRIYSLINIVGLSVSFVMIFFIIQYVHFERSFDQNHDKGDRIFRVGMELDYENSSTHSAGSFYGLGEQSQLEMAEIEDYFTLSFDNSNQGFLGYEDADGVKNFRLNGSHSASPAILDILDFRILAGSRQSALSGTSNVVITQSLAKRIFDNEPALGKTLTWYGTNQGDVTGRSFQVGAVIEDLPANSHFDFELLFPLKYFEEIYPSYSENIWTWYGYYNYLLLKKTEYKVDLEQKYPAFMDKHLNSRGQRPYKASIFLEQIKDIHLKSDSLYQIEEGGDYEAINILVLICILLSILVYTNYINLMTSVNLQRTKEVGIRKVLGSNQTQIMYQFLIEAVIINFVAFLIALGFIYLTHPILRNWIQGYPDLYLLNGADFWVWAVGVVLAVSIVTGIYPSLVVSRLKNVELFKGNFSSSSKGKWLHRLMVVFQFCIASVLLLFTIVINRQLQLMLKNDLGVNMDQVIVARAPLIKSGSYEEAVRNFQNKANTIPGITAVSSSTMVPGIPRWGNSAELKGRDGEAQVIRRMEIDEQYLNVYEHEVIAGRPFSNEFLGDEAKAMVNEKAAEIFGLTPKEIVGKTLFLNDTVEIVGVIRDYHHNSLKSEILPLVLTSVDDDIHYISMRIQATDFAGILDELRKTWETTFPGSPYDTFFADQNFERLYLKDRKFGRIVAGFTASALFIAGLGLFGLSLFSVVRRRKEISIRKVLGAPIFSMFWTFSKEILVLILMAGILSVPLSYLVVTDWLEGFANRVGFSLFMALLPLLGILVFALLAIGYNILKALIVNPIHALRHE